MNKEFIIPSSTEVIFVSDFFVEDLQGGAELTTEAFISYSPYRCFKLHASSVTEDLINKNKNKYWIICNATQMKQECWIDLVQQNVSYSIVEYDFKYCKYRSKHLHELTEKKHCDCHLQKNGRFFHGLMKRAKNVFFMSQNQINEYCNVFQDMNTWGNIHNQGSCWKREHIDFLKTIRERKEKHNGKWAVLGGGSWIKNQQETEQYLKSNHLDYDIIGGLPYIQFMEKLSKYKGLCFMPKGFDTAPRLVTEAKMIGIDLILNDNVLHKNEEWFTSDIETCENHLKTRGQHLWKLIRV